MELVAVSWKHCFCAADERPFPVGAFSVPPRATQPSSPSCRCHMRLFIFAPSSACLPSPRASMRALDVLAHLCSALVPAPPSRASSSSTPSGGGPRSTRFMVSRRSRRAAEDYGEGTSAARATAKAERSSRMRPRPAAAAATAPAASPKMMARVIVGMRSERRRPSVGATAVARGSFRWS